MGGLLGASWGPRCLFGASLGASWGPLGGLLGASWGASWGRGSWRRLGGLLEASWGPLGDPSKSMKKPMVLGLEANFYYKKTMVFVKLRVSGDSGGKGNQNCRMSRAFLPFLKRERWRRKEERESMKKGEEDRSTAKRKPTCPKYANVPSVFAVFVKMGDLIFSKSAKNQCKKQ